jgi:hypothetical protein
MSGVVVVDFFDGGSCTEVALSFGSLLFVFFFFLRRYEALLARCKVDKAAGRAIGAMCVVRRTEVVLLMVPPPPPCCIVQI